MIRPAPFRTKEHVPQALPKVVDPFTKCLCRCGRILRSINGMTGNSDNGSSGFDSFHGVCADTTGDRESDVGLLRNIQETLDTVARLSLLV